MIDYAAMFDSCVLTTEPARVFEIRKTCKVIMDNQVTYWGVEQSTGVPWLAVGVIHYRESSLDFKRHLHNGDPLTARTVHVPSGRPREGTPPFTWTASAVDALIDRAHPFEWSVAGILEFCEHYNGLGYQHHGVNSPYVWSCTDKYTGGLYIADGTIDLERKDSRPGVAALVKTMLSLGVKLEFKTGVEQDATLH